MMDGSTRRRVLVEHRDELTAVTMAKLLRDAGYDVEVCTGPVAARDCPLVATGRCAAAERADVVVHGLAPGDPSDRAVVAALRAHLPDVPVVMEASPHQRHEHPELVAGATPVEFPCVRRSLVEAVGRAGG